MILYIRADFDENGLETKNYTNLDAFILDRTGWPTFKDMKEALDTDDEELDGSEKHVMALLKNGCAENEWDTEEIYTLDGNMELGVNVQGF